MKGFLCLLVVVLSLQANLALVKIGAPATECDKNACNIENSCRCSNGASPLVGNLSDWPQLISITVDDAITKDVYDLIGTKLLFDRTNGKDESPIGATFFVPHEYTDYIYVNNLYNLNFEIGVNSITRNSDQDYWRYATVDTLVQEFQGQKQIISKFANIPAEKILGARTPQLQINANNTIQAYIQAELQYDSSWPSLPSSRMFPYTLDYLSTEGCLLGAHCPNEAFPGFWILPINDFTGSNKSECNVLAGCNVNGTADEIATWLTQEVEAIRSSTRVPITLMTGSSWFTSHPDAIEGFNKFMDNMHALRDVFFVNQGQVLDWIKSPVNIEDFKMPDPQSASCNELNCQVPMGTDMRNFNVCSSCPAVYPWLGNPDGNSQ